MAVHLSGTRTDEAGLDDLAPLWSELHSHHREVSQYQRLVEDLGSSWASRRDLYRRLLAQGASYITATDDRRRLLGYVMVAVQEGPDDTFEVTGGIAEVVTLIVTRAERCPPSEARGLTGRFRTGRAAIYSSASDGSRLRRDR